MVKTEIIQTNIQYVQDISRLYASVALCAVMLFYAINFKGKRNKTVRELFVSFC